MGLKEGLKVFGKTALIDFAGNTAACGVGALGETFDWPVPVSYTHLNEEYIENDNTGKQVPTFSGGAWLHHLKGRRHHGGFRGGTTGTLHRDGCGVRAVSYTHLYPRRGFSALRDC